MILKHQRAFGSGPYARIGRSLEERNIVSTPKLATRYFHQRILSSLPQIPPPSENELNLQVLITTMTYLIR